MPNTMIGSMHNYVHHLSRLVLTQTPPNISRKNIPNFLWQFHIDRKSKFAFNQPSGSLHSYEVSFQKAINQSQYDTTCFSAL